MSMRAVVVVLAGVLAVAACRGGGSKTKRTGSAAPVEVVTQPQLPTAGSGAGPNTDEVEPNDGEDVASPITLGGTARGKLEGDKDSDYYRLEVDKAGTLQVTLSAIDADLDLELLDGSGSSLGKSERTGSRIKEGIPNQGVTPGRYTIVVRHPVKKKAPKPAPKKGKKGSAAAVVEAEEPQKPAPVYELAAVLATPATGAEREPDDDRGTANDLIVADNATGFIGWTDDKDVWKLSVETLSEKNALDIQVSAIEGVVLTLEVADGVGTLLATRKAPRGQPVIVRGLLPFVRDGAPPFHYLTVRGDRSNPETAYTLHATAQVLGPDAEVEPNDLADKPQTIPADRTVVHASWTAGDIDCFAIAPSEAQRTIDIAIDTPSELNLDGELLVDGKVVAVANKGGKGVLEKLSAPLPPNAVAVVRIKNPDANATAEATYDVSVQETTATNDNAP